MGQTSRRYKIINVRFTVSDPAVSLNERLTKATFLFDSHKARSGQQVIDAVNEEPAPHRALRTAVQQWRTRITTERPFDVLTWNLFFATAESELSANGLEVIDETQPSERLHVGENPSTFGTRSPVNQLTFEF